jgi:hypothetical protein
MDSADLDLEDLPPKALRKLIKSLLAKAGKPASSKDADEADDERKKLSDLHSEHKGKPPEIPVTEEDLPFDTGDDEPDDEDDSPSEDMEEEADDKKAPPPFIKKGKKKDEGKDG